jgi:hypothetical protein
MGGGTIDLNGLSLFDSSASSGAPAVEPNIGVVYVGPDDDIDAYTGISGPMSFGAGGVTLGSSGSGDTFGVNAAPFDRELFALDCPHRLRIRDGACGFLDLRRPDPRLAGLDAWNVRLHLEQLPAQDDSLTVKIGAIPEPSTWAMMLLGFAALGFAGFRATRKPAPVTA